MKPVSTPLTDHHYVGPPGSDVGALPAFLDAEGATCSVWELTDEEQRAVKEGGRVLLAVYGDPPPPVALSVVGPYDEKESSLTVWSSRLETWTIGVEE